MKKEKEQGDSFALARESNDPNRGRYLYIVDKTKLPKLPMNEWTAQQDTWATNNTIARYAILSQEFHGIICSFGNVEAARRVMGEIEEAFGDMETLRNGKVNGMTGLAFARDLVYREIEKKRKK